MAQDCEITVKVPKNLQQEHCESWEESSMEVQKNLQQEHCESWEEASTKVQKNLQQEHCDSSEESSIKVQKNLQLILSVAIWKLFIKFQSFFLQFKILILIRED